MAADVSGYAKPARAALRAGVREAPDVAAAVPRRHRGRARATCGRAAAPTTTRSSRPTTGPGSRRSGGTRWPPRASSRCRTGSTPGRLPEPPAGDSPGAVDGGETEGQRRVADLAASTSGRTTTCTTTWRPTARHGSARTSGSVVSRRWPWPTPRASWTAAGPAAFVRQLGWRDFYYQVTDAFPKISTDAYRRSGDLEWRNDPDALQHWQDGRTGVPVVDAGMRQLRAEGWMHNRARLITAAFLTKHLGLDWRARRAVVLPLAARRRRGQQLGQLAVGGRHRQRHQAVPPVQSDPAGRALRPRRRVRSSLRTRTEIRRGQGRAPAVAPARERAAGLDYPGPLESHRDEAVWLRP